MDIQTYLHRIGYTGGREPTEYTLRKLHRCHLYAVPFENLDITLGRPITLALPLLFEKIVRRRRGGFCYELNGLFGWLLRELGFDVHLLSGRVFEDSVPGPEFDHLVLTVRLREPLLADVGFGDSFVEPLFLQGGVQSQRGDSYRLDREAEGWVLHRRRADTDWEPQYAFSSEPRALDDFGSMCEYHQTSPDSTFTRKSVCSLATREGRVTMSNERFILTTGTGRREQAVSGPGEYRRLLQTHFGFDPGTDPDIARLMAPGGRHRDDGRPAGPDR